MDNSLVELNILVKVENLNYRIIDNNSTLINKHVIDNKTNTDWNSNRCFILIQFELIKMDDISNIIITLYPLENNNNYNIDNNTYCYPFNEQNIEKVFNKYYLSDYFILMRNLTKMLNIIETKYRVIYEKIIYYIKKKKRTMFCIDSILKTIVKIPLIVQGRQMLKKYRVPNYQMVFDKLKIKNNICHLNNIEADKVFLLSIIDKIKNIIFDCDYIKDSANQMEIFLAYSNLNLNIKSKSSYNGKTTSAIFRVISLVYSGIDIENIYYIVANHIKKKNIDSFWTENIEPILGYSIKVYTIESFIKQKNLNMDHIIIDINNYNETSYINMLDEIIKTYNINITYVGNVIKSDYIKTIISNEIVIEDIDFERNELVHMTHSDIDKYFKTQNMIFIIDKKISLDIKNMIRNNVSRDHMYSPKKITLELLETINFNSTYLIYNKFSDITLSPEILNELQKRTSLNYIVFLE